MGPNREEFVDHGHQIRDKVRNENSREFDSLGRRTTEKILSGSINQFKSDNFRNKEVR